MELEQDISVLHCVESGSRAWGFASPDSDYDVRAIYARDIGSYLRLDAVRDVVEWRLDDVLDINGWDIAKALRLARSSNPTLFEWMNSPIVYKSTPQWQNAQDEIRGFFAVKPSAYHYLNMARNNNRSYLAGDWVKTKKYLYAIRPLLACRWVLDKGVPPPMLFSELAASELEPELWPAIDDLLALKASSSEASVGPRISELNTWIESNISIIENKLALIKADKKPDWPQINRLFIELIQR